MFFQTAWMHQIQSLVSYINSFYFIQNVYAVVLGAFLFLCQMFSNELFKRQCAPFGDVPQIPGGVCFGSLAVSKRHFRKFHSRRMALILVSLQPTSE